MMIQTGLRVRKVSSRTCLPITQSPLTQKDNIHFLTTAAFKCWCPEMYIHLAFSNHVHYTLDSVVKLSLLPFITFSYMISCFLCFKLVSETHESLMAVWVPIRFQLLSCPKCTDCEQKTFLFLSHRMLSLALVSVQLDKQTDSDRNLPQGWGGLFIVHYGSNESCLLLSSTARHSCIYFYSTLFFLCICGVWPQTS